MTDFTYFFIDCKEGLGYNQLKSVMIKKGFSMKKVLFSLIILVLLPLNVYAAPDRVDQWDAGINISDNLSTKNNVSDGLSVGSNFSYGIKNWLGVGISLGWSDARYNLTDGTKGGRVTSVPVFGDIIFRVPTFADQHFVPYGVLGLGGIFDRTHGAGVTTDRGLQAKPKDGFAVKLGAGVDWFMAQNWIYNFETGYVFTDAKVDLTNGNNVLNSSVDLDYWYLGGGVKWLLD